MRKKTFLLFFLFLWYFQPIHNSEDIYTDNRCDSNCTWTLKNVTSKTINSFPSFCETVCGDLSFNRFCNVEEKDLAMVFKELKHLIGNLEVNATKFKSLSFLAGLESIEAAGQSVIFLSNLKMKEIGLTNLTTIIASRVQISATYTTKRLNIPNLKNVSSGNEHNKQVSVEMIYLPKDFCITYKEMEMFLNLDNVIMPNFTANFCEPTLEDKVCTKPVEGCVRLQKDMVLMNVGFDTESMKTIEEIYGMLVINGTDFTNLDFLRNLKYVAQIQSPKSYYFKYVWETNPTILITNNKQLVNYSLPNLKKVIQYGEQTIRFSFTVPVYMHRNNEILDVLPQMCFDLQSAIGGGDGSVKFRYETCDDLEREMPRRIQEREKNPIVWLYRKFIALFQ